MISRRNFLKGGIVLSGVVILDGFVLEPKDVEVQRLDVRIAGLPPAFNGFTICQLTDIHHSPVVSLGYIDRVVNKANSLKPDLVALTGDYIDDEREYAGPVIESLSGLKSSHGIVSILGNHDYFIGESHISGVIAQSRIPLLKNSHMIIRSGGDALCIAGVRDYLQDRPDAKEALKGAPVDMPRILLSHHPDYSEYLPEGERIDLVLSGHTHGGQVRLPLSFAPVVPSEFGQRYSGGLVRNRHTQVYVSRGVGVSTIPVRFNCPPEITLIRLVA